ncbi:alpha/beta-hydrolase [Cadophora sp. DSE1049]|nr:alpha/beta-hydrolase [Cadophora sp. DSE1049]
MGKDGYVPTEGGPDSFVVDVGYYARRVGLDSEEVKVQTEDGFVLDLWHVYDPREYTPLSRAQRMVRGPESIDDIRPPSRESSGSENPKEKGKEGEARKQKYPVLMMPGLMQSSGVYCTNDEHSLAFWLCKQGYDVWLGNNRCGFNPQHVEFKKGDPRMWNWNITHMATLDLPALTARILSETSSPTLGLIAHSQGTTQTLIALSKHQRPTLSTKLSVFCALAPAAYTGPLLNQHSFKLLRLIPTRLFRLTLGRKSFLPFISLLGFLQGKIPQHWIGSASYKVYNYVFGWGDSKWDRGVRDRNFLFAPTRISALAMQWWLSREGFAYHGSILSSHEQVQREVEEDLLQDYSRNVPGKIEEDFATSLLEKHVREPRAPESWFPDGISDAPGSRPPPMAFWIAGDDTLCDGRELLNRFERGREPGMRVLEGGKNVVEGYSHLDVVWACDVIERVGWGVRDADRESEKEKVGEEKDVEAGEKKVSDKEMVD